MQIVIKNLSELQHPDKNVRLHGDRQIKEYIRSIEMFGQIRPMVIDETNTVLAGNGLLQALQQMNRETAECVVVKGLSSKQKKKLMLVDNKIFELGVNDAKVFDELLLELDGDIDIPGYDEELLKILTASLSKADEVISSYGTFSEESVGKMKNAQPIVPQAKPANVTATAPAEQAETTQSVQRFVVCPKCGEKIWL